METAAYQRKKIEDGPFFEGWQTQYIEWPWWTHVLLIFKRAKWMGCDGIEYKIKTLLGTYYLVGVRKAPPSEPDIFKEFVNRNMPYWASNLFNTKKREGEAK